MKNLLSLLLLLSCIVGCKKDNPTGDITSHEQVKNPSEVKVEPVKDFKDDEGTSFTIWYKENLQYQGNVALTKSKTIQFAIKNDANESIAPQIASTTISIPAISVLNIAGKPNHQNSYFVAELPLPVTLPTSVSLYFTVQGEEPNSVDLLLE